MNKYVKYSFAAIVFALLILGISYSLLPKPDLLTNVSFSQAVYAKQQQLLNLSLSNDDKYRLYIPLNKLSPLLVEATLLQEDKYFYRHPGINPWAISRAIWQTYILRERRVGGSTITMQLARLRYKLNSKTLSGKLLQIFRALQLERHYSKATILEAYLNLAPYGGNIEGAGAASIIYFNKSVSELTLPEALTLAVIPQNPLRRKPSTQHWQALAKARSQLFSAWLSQHPHDKTQQHLVQLPLSLNKTRQLPHVAQHFVREVMQKNSIKGAVATFLDLKQQRILEKVANNYLARKHNLGVDNVAMLLINAQTMGVQALVGSADFFSQKIAGQVNGVTAKRSPGSALKPFIYALAIDQGIIHPNTVLKDAPRSFGAYNPENFDNEFMGPIKAVDALILSRNIPAIALAEQLTKPTLYQFLQQADVTDLKAEQHYGLALVLGGAEVTMEELIQLYAMLANQGYWQPVRYYQQQAKLPAKKLLSAEAAFLVTDMLQSNLRPAFFKPKLPIAWKTGTSSGFRDAWAVAIFGQYVLAVWVGNFNGNGNPAFIGREIAAPLMFEVIDALDSQTGPIMPMASNPAQLNLKKINICTASGMLPTRFCKHTSATWFIPGKSPIKTDTIFREVMIDGKTGLRSCQVDKYTQFKVYEFWPSDLAALFRQAGIRRLAPPPFLASCNALAQTTRGVAPRITSPQAEVIYTLPLNKAHDKKLVFSATAESDVNIIYWFVNETFVGKSTPEQALLWPATPGKFIVRAVDDHGRADARELRVQSL